MAGVIREKLRTHQPLRGSVKILYRLLITLFLLATTASGAESQLEVGAGVAYAEALDGQWGVDARLSYSFRALPVDIFVGGDYFRTNCDEACSLWGLRFGGNYRIPIPFANPYLTGTLVEREWTLGDEARYGEGISLGFGVSVRLGISAFGEVTREFLGDDLDQWVLRVGLRI